MAELLLHRPHHPLSPEPLETFAEATTDAGGRFALRLQDLPGSVVLSARKAGFASIDESFDLKEGGVFERRYVLKKASGRIEGVVEDADGVGIAAAWVSAAFPQIYSPTRRFRTSTLTVRADDRGRFVIDQAPSGEVALSALAKGYFQGWANPQLEDGQVVHQRIRLEKGQSTSIQVTTSEGEGIPNASLRLGGGANLPHLGDENGTIEFLIPSDMPSTPFEVEVAAAGYLARIVTLEPKDLPCQVELEVGPEAQVEVVDDSGKPVEGATVSIGGLNHRFEETAKTAANGLAFLRLSYPPIAHASVSHPDFVPYRSRFEDDPGLNMRIQLQKPEAGVSGRFIFADGTPVFLFRVTLRASDGRSFYGHFDNPGGEFALLDLSAGVFQMNLQCLVDGPMLGASVDAGQVNLIKGQVLAGLLFQLDEKATSQ